VAQASCLCGTHTGWKPVPPAPAVFAFTDHEPTRVDNQFIDKDLEKLTQE
jgi:hypothetical protein